MTNFYFEILTKLHPWHMWFGSFLWKNLLKICAEFISPTCFSIFFNHTLTSFSLTLQVKWSWQPQNNVPRQCTLFFFTNREPTPIGEQIKNFRDVYWWHYNKENHTYLSINTASRNLASYRQNEFHFWNDYYPKLAGYSTCEYRVLCDWVDFFFLTQSAMSSGDAQT